MASRSYTPSAFFSDHPPERYMGTECEYSLQFAIPPHEDMGYDPYIDEQALALNGIFYILGKLSNGGGMYFDGVPLEYTSAEALGPLEAAAADLAGVLVLSKMIETSYLPHHGLYRLTGTSFPVISNDVDTWETQNDSLGYHENFLFPRSEDYSVWLNRIIPTHLASRFWAWVPTLDQQMVLSQKIVGIGGEPIARNHERRTVNGDKPMVLIPPITTDEDILDSTEWARLEVRFADAGQSPFGRYMSLGVTSVLMRIVEQSKKLNLRKVAEIQLEDPLMAAWGFSTDWSFKQKTETVNGKFVTALDVQEVLAEAALDLSTKIELPPSEKAIPALWMKLVDRLRKTSPDDGDWQGLEKLLDIAAKHLYLTTRFYPDELGCDNDEAMAQNLIWDRVLPAGGALLWWAANPNPVVGQDLINKRVVEPPEGRALRRSEFIMKSCGSSITNVSWRKGVKDGKDSFFSL